MAAFGFRRETLPNPLIKGQQTHGILLTNHQITERSGKADCIIEFCQILPVGVSHRLAKIHHEIANKVGLCLELFDVVLVGLRENQPVNIFGIVSRRILTVLAKLDRKTVKWAAMQALHEAFNDELRA